MAAAETVAILIQLPLSRQTTRWDPFQISVTLRISQRGPASIVRTT
jgi:hypothetical protein